MQLEMIFLLGYIIVGQNLNLNHSLYQILFFALPGLFELR